MAEEQVTAPQPVPGRDVFISYASHDKAVADAVCEALEAAGTRCFIAPRDVIPGEFYAESIVHAIDSCRVAVLILSRSAAASGHVLREVERASSKGHPVVSLRIDTEPLPAGLEYFLNSSQWLDASAMGFTRALPRLVEAVRVALTQSSATARVAQGRIVTTRAVLRSHRLLVVLAVAIATGLTYFIVGRFWLARHALAEQPMTAATNVVSNDSSAASVKSVAVLPFENLSGLAGDADLADGLQEEILNALARLQDLKVISRTSVMEFRGKTHNVREIGQKLGVGSILEGSIRRDRGVLRLTVQLVDARTDRHLFAANYDRDPTHVLNLQSAVARQVADALAATLSGYERGEFDRVTTNSGDAYDRYLRAVAKFRRPVLNDEQGVVEPIRLLEEAVRFDPNYAEALALLSQAHTSLYHAYGRSQDRDKAGQAADRAFAIDPRLPEARLARGLYALYVSQDPDQALIDLKAVVAVRPNSAFAQEALGYGLRRSGRVADSLPYFVRAWDLDPLNYSYALTPWYTLVGLRRIPEAIEQTQLWSKRFPEDISAYLERGRLEALMQHSIQPLRAAFQSHEKSLDPPDHASMVISLALWEGRYLDAIRLVKEHPYGGEMSEATLAGALNIGMWYRAAGDSHNAELSFRRAEQAGRAEVRLNPRDKDVLGGLALVESMLGEHKEALATIERARSLYPEAHDAIDGPPVSFMRSVILVRAGYAAEGYAEAARLLRVPFSNPAELEPVWLLLKDDPKYDEILHHPPRL